MHVKALIVFPTAWLLSAPAHALESVYTPLGHKACKIDKAASTKLPRTHDLGRPNVYRCAGIADHHVVVIYHGVRVSFELYSPGQAKPFNLATPYDTGQQMEWRGTGSARNFVPTAIIVRLSEKIGSVGNIDKLQSVLVVIKLAGGSPCIIGVVDMQANANANLLAREAADSAATTECESSNTIRGIATPYALELFENNAKLRKQ